MMRRTAFLAMGVLLLDSLAARAAGPVCRQPSVVREIAREVRQHNYYARIEPGLVFEYPTADPSHVVCQACVLAEPYDFSRVGEAPIARCVARNFDVRIATRGFIVGDWR